MRKKRLLRRVKIDCDVFHHRKKTHYTEADLLLLKVRFAQTEKRKKMSDQGLLGSI